MDRVTIVNLDTREGEEKFGNMHKGRVDVEIPEEKRREQLPKQEDQIFIGNRGTDSGQELQVFWS